MDFSQLGHLSNAWEIIQTAVFLGLILLVWLSGRRR